MKTSLYLFLLAGLLFSCQDDKIGDKKDLSENYKVNEFIESHMTEEYLWAKQIQSGKISKEEAPAKYFNAIKYEGDRWSRLTDESANGTLSSTEDGSDYGFGMRITSWGDGSGRTLFAKINMVFPDSPADKAGLRKGDIIHKVNGLEPNLANMQKALSDKKVTLQIISQNESDTRNVSLEAKQYNVNPILKTTILVGGAKKIGYLVYASFVYKDQSSLDALSEVFTEFKNKGIDELIIDLRYNGGGYNLAAIHLASLIAPTTVVNGNDLLIRKQWNDKYETKYQNSPNMLEERFNAKVPTTARLGMDRVWILTNKSTASASEVVISGLSPYMKVYTVGERTTGKNAGGIVYTPGEASIKQWNAYLITFTYLNSQEESVQNGIEPNYSRAESSYFMDQNDWGNTNEYLLSYTLDLITGRTTLDKTARSTTTQAIPYTPATEGRYIISF